MTLQDRLEYFNENYDLLSSGHYGFGPKKVIGNTNDRKCRFCGKKEPDTTFKEESHAISEFFGNHQLILADECDACNHIFANNIEGHLGNFTKPYRTIAQVRGKKKIPIFTSFDQKNRIEKIKDGGLLIKAEEKSDFFVENEADNKIVLKCDIDTYIPCAVYKALVKIAISTIENDNELAPFDPTIKWILESNHSYPFMKPLNIVMTFVPGPNPNVNVASILLRKKPGKNVCHSIYILGWGNFVYQIIVPSIEDISLKTIMMPHFPLPFESNWPYGDVQRKIYDATSHEKVTENTTIEMSYERKIEIKDG
jgi:hypothetical protein